MAKTKETRSRRYWETLKDDELVDAELETDDPESLEDLVRQLPAGDGEPYVEFKYDLRGSGRGELLCVHGHHRHLAGFVMRKGRWRYLVGHVCAATLYGECFDTYKADFTEAVNRRDRLRKRREIENETLPFMNWLEGTFKAGAFDHYESIRQQLQTRMEWLWENAPKASHFGFSLPRGMMMPATFFDEMTDPRAAFAKAAEEMSALSASLINHKEFDQNNMRKIKRRLEGIVARIETVFSQLQELEAFFQPAILQALCSFANEYDNPKKRHYEIELLALRCKRDRNAATVKMPSNFRLPDRGGLHRMKEAIRMI